MKTTISRLAVFDLDGTLVDSRHDLAAAANAARAALGLPMWPVESVVRCIGEGAQNLIKGVTPEATPEQRDVAMAAFKAHYAAHCCDATPVYDGVVELIDRLTAVGWRLAVLTNKPDGFSRTILAHHGLAQRFLAITGGDRFRKPDPRGLNELITAAETTPAQAWMIGDHHTDIQVGRAAGCRTLFAAWGFGRLEGQVPHATATDPTAAGNVLLDGPWPAI